MQKNAGIRGAKSAIAVLMLVLLVGTQAQNSALAVGSSQNLTITSHTDDYVIQNQRIYAANILEMDAQLAAYKSNYENQLGTINVQEALLENKLQEVDKKLLPLEMLDTLSKHCVQKYRGKIATIAYVRANIASCVSTANTAYASIVSTATTTRNNLNNWYNNQLKTLLSECQRKHVNSQLNYTICATQAIATADSTTASSLKTFNTQFEQTQCSGDSRVKQSVDCSFTIVYNTISMVGEITRLIDNCVQGLEFCPPCNSVPTNNACPNELNLSFRAEDYRNSTISNPFYGWNSTIPCVQVNFAQPS